MTEKERRSWLKTWLIAARPWALPASTIPVLFGSSLAATVGWVQLDVGLLLLSLMAMAGLHTAANMLSDVVDWKRGLDREVTPVSGAIVRGWLSSSQLLRGSLFLFGFGSALGLVLVWLRGILILKIGLAGIILGAAYPWLKALALGDLVVELDLQHVPPSLRPSEGLPDTDTLRQSMPALMPPLSATISADREDRF